MHQILFICTGNFYRSRFAEIYFNHLATGQALVWQAFSRGLEVFKYRNVNHGPISQHTLNYLEELAIPAPEPIAQPQQIGSDDFLLAHTSILMYEQEHRPMMGKYHPEMAEAVTYWTFPDIDICTPDEVLPQVKGAVETLVMNLGNGQFSV